MKGARGGAFDAKTNSGACRHDSGVLELLDIVGYWLLGKIEHRPRLTARLAGIALVTVTTATVVFVAVLLVVLLR
jgi:hypothetical protein